MGSFFSPGFIPPPDIQIRVEINHRQLASHGLNMPVVISPHGVDLSSDKATYPVVVSAHLDTGASVTSIDIDLALQLGLKPTGVSQFLTAGGPHEMPSFVVDLDFPESSLKSVKMLPISSCRLMYDGADGNHVNPDNFAILIGRDILSRWNIIWNGPTSTVIIND
ncbi:MAG: retropepsin-like domain-containing protein [Chitinispirillales bacterium]|jgi:hypothetical protein|nr:retropepsin-like domain-containing protein [Chitinispirillales bacterium]